ANGVRDATGQSANGLRDTTRHPTDDICNALSQSADRIASRIRWGVARRAAITGRRSSAAAVAGMTSKPAPRNAAATIRRSPLDIGADRGSLSQGNCPNTR
ncbi:MAG: hypothetical protein JWR13_4601, partial [Mycobacterium sp.]|nr:hypothetical protein [Mycobacterium sp.]